MLFSEVADLFDRIEAEPSRLAMTSILSDFFRNAPKERLADIVYLIQGKLRPDFYPQVLGMSDKLVIKAIAATAECPNRKLPQR